jgi:ubiquinone/menaquinone biosynthesis C-methylase UbiE
MRPTTSIILDPMFTLQPLQIEEGMQVASLGCGGHGHFLFPIAKLVGPKGKVYAVDIRKPALNSIQRQAEAEGFHSIVPIWSDVEQLGATKIPAASVNRATLFNTLHQMKDKLSALKEARRLLASGGRLLVVDWSTRASLFGPPVAERVSLDNLIKLAKEAGLTAEMHFEPGPYHFGILFTPAI